MPETPEAQDGAAVEKGGPFTLSMHENALRKCTRFPASSEASFEAVGKTPPTITARKMTWERGKCCPSLPNQHSCRRAVDRSNGAFLRQSYPSVVPVSAIGAFPSSSDWTSVSTSAGRRLGGDSTSKETRVTFDKTTTAPPKTHATSTFSCNTK